METPTGNRIEKLKEKRTKIRKKVVIGSVIALCTLLAIYFGVAIFFMNHFYFGSTINAFSVSGKSVEEVNEQMAAELQKYTLELKGRDGKNEQIKADEIGLKYNSGGEFRDLKDKQNPYEWVSTVFNTEGFEMVEGTSFDRELLKERMDKLSYFDSSNIIEPKNPGFEYKDNAYVIIPEVLGNKVNKGILYEHLEAAILNEETSIDLEAIDCYVKPQYTSNSQKIIEVKDKLNKYASSSITYTFGEDKEILDGSAINKWLTVDENYEVIFNEQEVKNYVDVLADKYNTVAKIDGFVTTSGSTVSITRGDYGWTLNNAKETEALSTAIKEGQTITKEPAYSQTGLSRTNSGIGNTYVEIDLTNQHMWFYKDGELIVEGNVVTGNVSAKHTTPPGIYKLKYKQRNAILRGPGYASPVSFWMPFNGGIGIHDANWRSEFGGTIYKTNGSHGCINSPYNVAKAIYENIQVGTPVVCYN